MIKAVVIGERCEDVFVYCNSTRLSPEAPVPVLNPIHTSYNDGMSGNVICNIKSLTSESVDVTHIYQSRLITKVRYVDDKSNHMFIRIDSGEFEVDQLALNDQIEAKILDADFVVVSDYNKGFLNDNQLEYIGKISKLSIIDSKRVLSSSIVNNYNFVKLNESEAQQNRHLENKNLLITMGGKGCKYHNQMYPSPKPQETIDVSGAGDTFTSAFILNYFKTKDISKSIDYANYMASIVVGKRGVTTVN